MTDIAVKITAKFALARDVVAIRLAPVNPSDRLPAFEAGAHIDVRLTDGLCRQYSLTNVGDSDAPAQYEIAVARDAASRGGSLAMHDQLHVGSRLSVSAPRNLFGLDPSHQRIVLIAGGIGVTPLYAMAQQLCKQNVQFQLIFCARSAVRMAYLEELRALCGDRLLVHADDERGHPIDLDAVLRAQPWDGVYACGPTGMLDAIADITVDWAPGVVRMERFTADPAVHAPGAVFALELRASGLHTEVAANESVLDAIERLGVAHSFSCREGICGSCEAGVIEGTVDHRCAVLSQAEKDTQQMMMPCVSRCSSEKLVLNL